MPQGSGESGSSEPEATQSPSTPRSLVAVCTLNEATNIASVIARLRRALPHTDVLIVDDDSPDGTADVVQRIANEDRQVRLKVRKGQRGLGSAIASAMREAVDQGYDFFLNLDGDLSHDPDAMPRLLDRAIQSPTVDVVIGSRYVPGGQIIGWPWYRKIMSRLINRFATICLGLPVRDCSGSMRCYRVETLRRMGVESIHSQGYAWLEEILMRLHNQGATIVEVPITFTDRQTGTSKLTLREAIRTVGRMLRLAWEARIRS